MFVAVLVYFGSGFVDSLRNLVFPAPAARFCRVRFCLNLDICCVDGRKLPQTRLAPRQLPLGGSLWRARKLCTLVRNFAVTAEAFPRSGEGGCERSEQTDEGAGKWQFVGNHPSSGANAPPSPQGVKALAHPEGLHFSQKLCRHAKGPIPEGAVCDQREQTGGVLFPIILPFYTFSPRFGGKIMSELK